MTQRQTKQFFLLLAAMTALFFCPARAEESADDAAVFTLTDENGTKLCSIHAPVSQGDEYISADNVLYRVISAKDGKAAAQRIGEEKMPDVSWLDAGEAQAVFADRGKALPAAAGDRRLITLYVTHSDESYVSGDGTQSIEGQGGIYDVARAFRDELQALGIDVILDESTHLPHDAGAYRRSRQTAQRLLEHMPDAIIDIHRDGIPDADEYEVNLDGKSASQVRLLVGRGNQNSSVNREFAKEIKAIADKQYPGLIKDIFIGKGTYNQDLSPNAILLEFGTHTISKERVLNSVGEMAHVVSNALYGSQTGAAPSQASVQEDKKKDVNPMKGVAWMLALVIVGLLLFAFLQTGGGSAMKDKLGRGLSEMTGGLVGKKRKDDSSSQK